MKTIPMKQLIIILLAVVIFSCNTDDDLRNSSEYTEYMTKNTLISDIDFMPQEIYTSSSTPIAPTLNLKLSTTEIFPCSNFEIATSEFIKGNELIIRFDGLVDTDLCSTAFGPAISFVELPDHINKIIFLNGSIVDQYHIEIDDQKISISLIERNFTNSLYDETFRYPENSFAFVCGTNTDNTHIYSRFLTLLEQNPDLNALSFDGEGRIPYPESSDGNWVNHPSKYFTYSDPQAFEDLETLLRNYTTEHIEKNSGVTIALYGWNNVTYFSWSDD